MHDTEPDRPARRTPARGMQEDFRPSLFDDPAEGQPGGPPGEAPGLGAAVPAGRDGLRILGSLQQPRPPRPRPPRWWLAGAAAVLLLAAWAAYLGLRGQAGASGAARPAADAGQLAWQPPKAAAGPGPHKDARPMPPAGNAGAAMAGPARIEDLGAGNGAWRAAGSEVSLAHAQLPLRGAAAAAKGGPASQQPGPGLPAARASAHAVPGRAADDDVELIEAVVRHGAARQPLSAPRAP